MVLIILILISFKSLVASDFDFYQNLYVSYPNRSYHYKYLVEIKSEKGVRYEIIQDNNVYQYDYDLLGRLRRVVMPNGDSHVIEIDDFGDITRIIRDNIGSVEYSYDNLGRLIQKDYFDNAGVDFRTEKYTLDNHSRITKTENIDNLTNESIRIFNWS